MINFLVEKKLDMNARDEYGETPLHRAARAGKTSAALELIALGADKSVVAGSHGTPLHQAAVGGQFETMLALLEKGCPLDKLSSIGQSVLHFASEGGMWK